MTFEEENRPGNITVNVLAASSTGVTHFWLARNHFSYQEMIADMKK